MVPSSVRAGDEESLGDGPIGSSDSLKTVLGSGAMIKAPRRRFILMADWLDVD